MHMLSLVFTERSSFFFSFKCIVLMQNLIYDWHFVTGKIYLYQGRVMEKTCLMHMHSFNAHANLGRHLAHMHLDRFSHNAIHILCR